MNTTGNSNRIHPLIATAAVTVTLVSLLGIAAIAGVLPSSHGLTTDVAHTTPIVPSVPNGTNSSYASSSTNRPLVAHHADPKTLATIAGAAR